MMTGTCTTQSTHLSLKKLFHDVIVRALADEGLVAVVLPAGGRPVDQLVVILAGPRELAVRAAEHRVAEVVVCQRKGF